MNRSFRIVTFALALLAISAASASAQLRVATVDLAKAFNAYWKKAQVEAVLKEEQDNVLKERKTMEDDFKKLKEAYQKLIDSASDPAISADEREKRKTQADDKLKQIKQKQEEYNTFNSRAEVDISERRNSAIKRLIGEIRNVVAVRAKSANYTLVVDAGGETSTVIYANGDTDITPEVIKDLNANAPTTSSSTDSSTDKKQPEKKK